MSDETVFFLRHTPPDRAALGEQIAQAQRELDRARADGDALRAMECAGDLGAMLTADRQEARAAPLMREHLALARQHPQIEASAWLLHGLATAEQYNGHRDEADRRFAEALALARAQGWRTLEHFVLHHWGRCLAEQRAFDRARECFTASLAIREALGDERVASSRRALALLAQWQAGESGAPVVPGTPPTTHVFVFGTLKQGFPNFATNRGTRVPGRFRTVAAYPLYLVGERHTPWLIDSPGQGLPVTGEVYEVDAAALAAMDTLERVHEPDGYVRQTLSVRPCDGPAAAALEVQVYLKPAQRLSTAEVRVGPLAEYLQAHAALYRQRPG